MPLGAFLPPPPPENSQNFRESKSPINLLKIVNFFYLFCFWFFFLLSRERIFSTPLFKGVYCTNFYQNLKKWYLTLYLCYVLNALVSVRKTYCFHFTSLEDDSKVCNVLLCVCLHCITNGLHIVLDCMLTWWDIETPHGISLHSTNSFLYLLFLTQPSCQSWSIPLELLIPGRSDLNILNSHLTFNLIRIKLCMKSLYFSSSWAWSKQEVKFCCFPFHVARLLSFVKMRIIVPASPTASFNIHIHCFPGSKNLWETFC